MRNIFRWLLFSFLLLSARPAVAQPAEKTFFDSISKYDLSKIWRSDSLYLFEWVDEAPLKSMMPFPEPLGYIGDDFQRLFVHFISVSRDKNDPYKYNVTGKTKVKDNVCTFKGTMTITKAVIYTKEHGSQYQQGYVKCYCLFLEDNSQQYSGKIAGEMTSYWFFDERQNILYNTLDAVADGFRNNQFTGTWTSYKTGMVKKCNWGDYRIPDSRNLDIGTGEFYPADKYLRNGWQTFRDVNSSNHQIHHPADSAEYEHWWEDKAQTRTK